jgi:hypothetical protein
MRSVAFRKSLSYVTKGLARQNNEFLTYLHCFQNVNDIRFELEYILFGSRAHLAERADIIDYIHELQQGV